MSYQVYKTEGIVLGSWDTGEADKIYSIYTKDFGRLNITAQGVRYLKSKLRYSLSTFSYLGLAFVKTKESFRLVDAEEIKRISPDKSEVFFGLAKTLNRMVKGEEADSLIWRDVKDVFELLRKSDLSSKELKLLEILANLRILYQLGYVDDKEELLDLLRPEVRLPAGSRTSLFDKVEKEKSLIVSAINKAFQESQL